MPKNPDKLSSQSRWWAFGLLPLAAGVIYSSLLPNPKPSTKTLVSSKAPKAPQIPEKSPPLETPETSDLSALTKAEMNLEPSLEHGSSSPNSVTIPFSESDGVQSPPHSNREPVQESPSGITPSSEAVLESPEVRNPLSAPSLSALLNHQATTSNDHSASTSNPKPAGSDTSQLESIALKKADSLDRVSLDRYKGPEKQPFENSYGEKQPRRSLLSQVSPNELSNEPPTSKNSVTKSPSSSVNKTSNSKAETSAGEQEDDVPPFPSAKENKNGESGTALKLAKPYCFLLPKGSPAVQCAMESVKLIVEEYAKADVHVIPVFRWWGDDYSDDPGTLEKQAIEACNLQAAFPWIEGGNKVASIQAFVRHPIPSIQCGKDPVKDPVSGCSNLCPNGSPSFSTVSEQECSAGTALHESGHSNCCAAQCKNTGDCQPKPEIDAGCGLCLQGGGSQASLDRINQLLASNAPKECKLTAAALDSIRAGASRNPGYLYNPNKQYKPRGKKLDSIFGKKGVKKLLRGVGDKADGDESGEGEGTPISSDDGATTSRRTSSTPKKGNQENGEDPIVPLKNPTGYTPDQIENFTREND